MDYLRTHPSVAPITTRIVAKTPPEEKQTDAWVKVTLIDAPQNPRSGFDHLVAFALQLDCYAGFYGGKPQANDLARAVRAALVEMQGAHGGATVSGTRITAMPHVPDPDLKAEKDNQRERYIVDAEVFMHG